MGACWHCSPLGSTLCRGAALAGRLQVWQYVPVSFFWTRDIRRPLVAAWPSGLSGCHFANAPPRTQLCRSAGRRGEHCCSGDGGRRSGGSAATNASSVEDGQPGPPAVRPGIKVVVVSWHLQRLDCRVPANCHAVLVPRAGSHLNCGSQPHLDTVIHLLLPWTCRQRCHAMPGGSDISRHGSARRIRRPIAIPDVQPQAPSCQSCSATPSPSAALTPV